MKDEKINEAVTTLMATLDSVVEDSVNRTEQAFRDLLTSSGFDSNEQAEYVETETTKALDRISERAINLYKVRSMLARWKEEEKAKAIA